MRYLPILLIICALGGCSGVFSRDESKAEVQADKASVATQKTTFEASDKLAQTQQELADLRAKRDAELAASKKLQDDAKAAVDAAWNAKAVEIAQGSSNLGPISQAVDTKGLPDYAKTIVAQKDRIDGALGLPADKYPKPTVTLADLLADAKAALRNYESDAKAAQEKIQELRNREQIATANASAANQRALEAEALSHAAEQKALKAQRDVELAVAAQKQALAAKEAAEEQANIEARNAWLAKVGAGIAAAAIPLLMAALNASTGGGMGALGSILRTVMPAANKMQDSLETAHIAVASSDVGRMALSKLEGLIKNHSPDIATQIGALVASATGGRATGIEALFKLAAQSHVTDLGTGKAQAVASLLTTIRDTTIDTRGGMAITLDHILDAKA